MKPKLISEKKVIKIASNSVDRVINHAIKSRNSTKKIMIITLDKENEYNVFGSNMFHSEKIAMCEVAKKYILDLMFGK